MKVRFSSLSRHFFRHFFTSRLAHFATFARAHLTQLRSNCVQSKCAEALTRLAEHSDGMTIDQKVAEYHRIFHLYDTVRTQAIRTTK